MSLLSANFSLTSLKYDRASCVVKRELAVPAAGTALLDALQGAAYNVKLVVSC